MRITTVKTVILLLSQQNKNVNYEIISLTWSPPPLPSGNSPAEKNPLSLRFNLYLFNDFKGTIRPDKIESGTVG
jgi:hypothetical protein